MTGDRCSRALPGWRGLPQGEDMPVVLVAVLMLMVGALLGGAAVLLA